MLQVNQIFDEKRLIDLYKQADHYVQFQQPRT